MLYIVATPIGNLEDMSYRAVRVLSGVDFVIAEDTRQTRKLLSHYEIDKPVVALHAHSSSVSHKKVVARLVGESAALVTDAGTPGIADPGGLLVAALDGVDVEIVPIPGASAITAALSVAGMRANQFTFMGYAPHKKGRNSFFDEVENSSYTVVFFETPHRIGKTLIALASFSDTDRRIMVGRELTKLHETIYRTNVGGIKGAVPEVDFRGEFVIVVEAKK